MRQLKSLVKPKRLRLQGVPEGEMVKCQVPGCTYEGKQITAPHCIMVHGITLKDYKKKYPKAPTTSKVLNTIMSERKKKYWDEHPEAKKEFGDKVRAAWADPKHRKRYEDTQHLRLSKETREERSARMKALYRDRLKAGPKPI